MNIVIQTDNVVTPRSLHICVENLRHTVDNHRCEVCERIIRLIRVKSPPVQQYVEHSTGLAVFTEVLVIIHLLLRDVVYHQLEHLNRIRRQLVTLLRLQHFPEEVRVADVLASLFVDLDALN